MKQRRPSSASAVDSNARRLRINLLTVDYSAAQLSNFATGTPLNGDLVEAHGSLDAGGVHSGGVMSFGPHSPASHRSRSPGGLSCTYLSNSIPK